MIKRRTFLILVGIISLSLIYGQSGTSDNITDFIKKAYLGNLMQIKCGNLAMKNAKDGGVRSFGSQMIADHSQINEQLHLLVQTKNYNIRARDTSGKSIDKLLKKASPTGFDNFYISKMVTEDKELVALYQNALTINDPGIQNFVKSTLPVLKGHLSSAIAMANRLNIQTH
ncbi:MAG: putative rane protein [Mucilaginibacter sp.]|nr:putative rane protein [Mucilaginibacter sp.]